MLILLQGEVIAQDNQITVKGVVRDRTGETIVGANVILEGTTIGVVTNLDGEFEISAPSNGVLLISFVGYETSKIAIQGRPNINVELKDSESTLDEAVVVGFGMQKKASLVSSITTIRPEELKGPTSNLTNMIAGRVSGMIAFQRSGEPGLDNSQFFIRGLGSFGSGQVSPLILIDGVESSVTDMARLQPDDIEAFSVLKDATASAVYGARGANGVVLINTKSGFSGETKFSFRAENRVSTNTRNFNFADNITYMNLANEASLTRERTAVLPYSQTKIFNTAQGNDPYLYPSNNWIEQLIKPFTINQGYNMSAQGGGEKAKYYIAGTYNIDNGVLNVDPINNFNSNIKLRNYSIRSNINVNLTNSTEAIIRMYGQFDDFNGPVGGGAATFNRAIWSNPVMFPAVYPSEFLPFIEHPLFGGAITGYGSTTLLMNPYAEMVRGYQQYKTSMIQPQVEIKQNLDIITQGLSFRTMGFLKRYARVDVTRQYNPFFYSSRLDPATGRINLSVLNDGSATSVGTPGTEYLDYSPGDRAVNSRTYMESAINYNRTFNEKHAVSGMLITIFNSFEDGNAMTVQSSLPQRNTGVSGRFTYGYDDKYLAEFNFGYNGSERFAQSYRFGFFPSMGFAYRISNESFFEGLKSVVDEMKIRGTMGWVGNDAIGLLNDRFFYLSEVNMNNGTYGATFGDEFGYSRPGISVSRYDNPFVTWERSRQINLGLDFTLFNAFDVIVDAFQQNRYDILQPRSEIGPTMGLMATPFANTGEVMSRGVDLTLSYNKSVGRHSWINFRGNFTYATSKILKFDEVNYPDDVSYLSRVGHPVGQTFGYIAERYFVDDAEVANSPAQFGTYMGGDIKYYDTNGDGVISPLDMVPIGHPTTPEIIYGFGGTYGYRRWDISLFFQGSARSSFFINPQNISPFVINGGAQNGLLSVIADSHWSEENRDLYAFWPRMSSYFVENNNQTSTWWMRNGAFLRLKNVEVGYNAPTQFAEKLKLRSLRVYGSGSNLAVWSNFKMWDPEMGGSGLGYPVQSVYNLGVLLDF
ncbi:SusC/RagA family TonB-linked outer membrane protein [Belliella kenyensis]|uniref:SusC/RagA family TonB-linked outer membrane protein n=1 Tax=Belliella kenyensis TaxID=1472724 RepID=A0ABV8EJG0_9BACT|nr:TonB-dependent receptor [Belliella kenyensis]MCH7400984.1 TonB-dependent receptor [Belliella kenyensis]MDN3603982.1 TonB-dependent receptor [Belliella kenyensis]